MDLIAKWKGKKREMKESRDFQGFKFNYQLDLNGYR